jgi:hypothetical protein
MGEIVTAVLILQQTSVPLRDLLFDGDVELLGWEGVLDFF